MTLYTESINSWLVS